jgi:hypothetical protein
MKQASQNIPPQLHGQETNVVETVQCASIEEAHKLFAAAKERLKDISNWHEFAGPGSSRFSLADSAGAELYRMAQKGDHFYIDLPAPGSSAGNGLDWVRIEEIDENDHAEDGSEYITMTVRPVANPRNPGHEIAHFYDHESTSTFIVEHYGNKVSAAVHGRNEVPNNKDTGLYDTVRNTIIALSARTGLSGPQWKALVKGLLSTNE